MCGIAGMLRLDGGPPDAAALRRMAAALAHRGPDGEGIHVAGPFGLAHRRLAIIDPAGSRQPLVDEESGLALSYNGEVYNYLELRRELGEAGFRTGGDTEAVLRAWRAWGPAALERMRGMFAFALADPRAGRLHLVRDRLGIKPLYYAVRDDRVVFASELGALVAGLGETPELDREALSLYLRYGYVPTPLTIWRGISKLGPGCRLEVDVASGRAELHRWWQPVLAPRPRSEAAALEELEALLAEITGLYVRSDVPFGAFLSGGVDSSLVTALMAERLGRVRTYSIGFDDPQYNELPHAETAARTLGTDHRAELLPANSAIGLLPRLAARFGEPFADSSCLPTWLVSNLAARDVKMVLSGDGGDELFGGYASYAAVLGEGRGAGPLGRVLSWMRGGGNGLDWRAVHHRHRDTFDRRARARLLGTDPAAEPEDFPDGPEADPVLRCQARDLGTYLLDDILTKVDRASMDNSLEVRVPLLDHKLVEFALTLPLELRLREGNGAVTGKVLLKRAAERYFPREFLDRRKWGFGIPLARWLDGPLGGVAEERLGRGAPALAGVVDPEEVRRVWREYRGGRAERIGEVWNLLALGLWQEHAAGLRPVAAEVA
jgi:asparagine synthase (glutamine-hydrolysing)